MLRTLCFILASMVALSHQETVSDLGDLNLQNVGENLGLAELMTDSETSNNFLAGVGDLDSVTGEMKRQFIEMIRENSDNQEQVLEAFASYQNAGGIFGDPHFVLPLTPEVTLCFNWMENSDEFDNIIATKNHFVNARMLPESTSTSVSLSEKPRVYMSALAFVIPEYRMNIMVHPSCVDIKFYGKDHSDPISFSLEEGSQYTHGMLNMEVDTSADGSHYISLTIDDTTYRIILRAKASKPHVNFYFTNLTTSGSKMDGIVGQFYSKPVSIKTLTNQRAIITIGDMKVRAHRHKLNGHAPYTGLIRECWLVTHDSQEIFMKQRQRFQIESLVATQA